MFIEKKNNNIISTYGLYFCIAVDLLGDEGGDKEPFLLLFLFVTAESDITCKLPVQ